jgi:uncharacterized membrane protein
LPRAPAIPYYRAVPFDNRALPRGGPRAWLTLTFLAGLGLVIAAPWLAHRGSWLAPLVYAIFDPVCHQIAERSFHLWHEPLAVCHRCTGLYLGFALGIAIWPSFPTAARRLLARPRMILLFAAPLAVDAVLIANTGASRFVTGLVAAFPVALLALAAVAQLLEARSRTASLDATTPAPRGAT